MLRGCIITYFCILLSICFLVILRTVSLCSWLYSWRHLWIHGQWWMLGHQQTASWVQNEVVAYITVFFDFSASLLSIYGQLLSSTPSSSSLIMLVFLFAITLVISTKNRTSQYDLARWFLYTGFGSIGENQGRLVSIRSSFFSTLKKRNLSTKFCQSRYFV